MSETLQGEIIRRAKTAAENHGHIVGGAQTIQVLNELPVYSLKLRLPDADVSIFWIKGHKNLRIRATLPAFGHEGSVSVLDLHEADGVKTQRKEVWHNPGLVLDDRPRPDTRHYARLRVGIRDELRKLMVLDDMADVRD